jgi:hypothetical protein
MSFRISISRIGIVILLASFGSNNAIASSTTLQPLDATDMIQSWIVGQDVAGYSCWDQLDKVQKPVLQIQVSGKWISKTKGHLLGKSKYCTDPGFPVTVAYHWVVNVRGATMSNQSKSRSIKAREIIPSSGNSNLVITPSFTKFLFLNVNDSAAAFADALTSISQFFENGGSHAQTRPGYRISTDCTFKGIFLGGKVKFVEVGADFNVKVVNYFGDLNVRKVDFNSISAACGEWQVVDLGQDFTVKIVNVGEDFSIKYVNSFPGTP